MIRSDTTPGALSWDFVHAFGFGPRGQIWYGTVGNGWGRVARRREDLEAPGPTTSSALNGSTWRPAASPSVAIPRWWRPPTGSRSPPTTGRTGPRSWTPSGRAAKGPADTALPLLANEYVRRLGDRWAGMAACPPSAARSGSGTPDAGWVVERAADAGFAPPDSVDVGGRAYRGGPCGLRPCERQVAVPARQGAEG